MIRAGVLCALLLPASHLHAAPLTLAAAIDAAFARNPELAAVRQDIGIAEGERRQAGLLPNPELSWEAEDTRRDTRTTTVMLSQALELGGKRGARIDVAERGQDAARLELERRSLELRADVLLAFHAAARAHTAVELAGQSLQLAERGLRVADGRVRAGQVSPVEATRAQVQLAETELQLRKARTAQADSLRQLARVIGTQEGEFDSLHSADLAPGQAPTAAALFDRLEQAPALRLAEAQIQQREAMLGSARAQRVPNLTVSVGSQYSREDRERVNVVGMSMPLPLFDRNQGNVLAASRRADQARDLRNAVELDLRTRTRSALEQWSTASSEVESFSRIILPAAQQAVDTATRGFEMGKFGFIDVLDAQRTLIDARGRYLQALAAGSEARAAIERIYGANPL
ncbi:outer membrane efflux protein [Pseudomonas sp. StFLB209]|nr:TolC family protein [Pseudomonas sp. LJDD11]BAP45805.1 outer membrane efflux protein [Pseudomonas sp. StFLB209]